MAWTPEQVPEQAVVVMMVEVMRDQAIGASMSIGISCEAAVVEDRPQAA